MASRLPADSAAESTDNIGGMQRTKELLQEVVLLPILLRDVFRTMGISPPRGCSFRIAQLIMQCVCANLL